MMGVYLRDNVREKPETWSLSTPTAEPQRDATFWKPGRLKQRLFIYSNIFKAPITSIDYIRPVDL